jgi:uncharacterized GH25 family protein
MDKQEEVKKELGYGQKMDTKAEMDLLREMYATHRT